MFRTVLISSRHCSNEAGIEKFRSINIYLNYVLLVESSIRVNRI